MTSNCCDIALDDKEIIETEQGTGNTLALERILDLFADLCDRWGPFSSEHATGLSYGILNLLADILRAGSTVFTPLTVRKYRRWCFVC
jgi:hypothetical protein